MSPVFEDEEEHYQRALDEAEECQHYESDNSDSNSSNTPGLTAPFQEKSEPPVATAETVPSQPSVGLTACKTQLDKVL
jgi:hypothetical protein